MPEGNAIYNFITAVAPDDVYVGVSVGVDQLHHFDGTGWSRIRVRTGIASGDANNGMVVVGRDDRVVFSPTSGASAPVR